VVRGNKGDFTGAMKSWNKALSIYRKYGLGVDDTLVSTVLSHQRLVDQLKKRRGSGKSKLFSFLSVMIDESLSRNYGLRTNQNKPTFFYPTIPQLDVLDQYSVYLHRR
jgi:hypothetical protein